jgi:predicted transcriptional regulator
MNIVNDQKTSRFLVLFSLYIASNADYEHAINLETLAQNRGLDAADLRKVFRYLVEERFIEPRDEGGTEFHAVLTHKGVKVVEEVFLDNQKSTYYFPAYKEMRNKGR